MKKMLKKGFTIVELVIVVAVIAILSAVLIPTFSGVVKTAQTSADVSLVKNVNLILASENALEGKNATMEDALADVKDGGYDITKLTPTNSDNDILWDQANDRFVLLANGKYDGCGSGDVDTTNLYKLWKIYTSIPETQTYSIYWNGGALENAPVTVGFDAGSADVAKVTYSGNAGQSVIINTNGGVFEVNAATDTVNHHGDVNEVNVVAIAENSYHEFGKATFIKVGKGRVEVEADAEIGGIHMTSNDARVTNESGATLPTLTKESGVTFEGAMEATEEAAKEAAASVVAPAGVARIGLVGYETLQAAVDAAAGATVVLTEDIDLGSEVVEICDNRVVTVDLNAHAIVGNGEDIFYINSASLTVKGNGTINHSGEYDIFFLKGASSLTIDNGTFTSRANVLYTEGDDACYITINGGTFTSTGEQIEQGNINGEVITYSVTPAFYVVYANVEINGGTFNYDGNPGLFEENNGSNHTWANYFADCTTVINNATFNSEICFVRGTATINNATCNGQIATSSDGAGINTLTIKNGSFNFAEVNVMGSGVVEIQGGTFLA